MQRSLALGSRARVVFGLTLEDDTAVVLKRFPSMFGEGALRAIESCLVRINGGAQPRSYSANGSPRGWLPHAEEASEFVHEYEEARGRRFTPVEQLAANASADYLMAEIASQGFGGPDCADDEYCAVLREIAATPLISFR